MTKCKTCFDYFEPWGDEDYCCNECEPSWQHNQELLEPDYDSDDLMPEGW